MGWSLGNSLNPVAGGRNQLTNKSIARSLPVGQCNGALRHEWWPDGRSGDDEQIQRRKLSILGGRFASVQGVQINISWRIFQGTCEGFRSAASASFLPNSSLQFPKRRRKVTPMDIHDVKALDGLLPLRHDHVQQTRLQFSGDELIGQQRYS